MLIKISRSFSATIQLNPFEPVSSFCAAEADVEVNDLQDNLMQVHSANLDEFVRAEVKKTIAQIEASNLAAKGAKVSSAEKKEVAKQNAELDAGNTE